MSPIPTPENAEGPDDQPEHEVSRAKLFSDVVDANRLELERLRTGEHTTFELSVPDTLSDAEKGEVRSVAHQDLAAEELGWTKQGQHISRGYFRDERGNRAAAVYFLLDPVSQRTTVTTVEPARVPVSEGAVINLTDRSD